MTDDPASKLRDPCVPPILSKNFYNISHAMRNMVGIENKLSTQGETL